MAEVIGVIGGLGIFLIGAYIARLIWHAGSALKAYANSKEGHPRG